MSILTFNEQMPITQHLTGVNVEFNDMNQIFELFDNESFLPSTCSQSNNFCTLKESVSITNPDETPLLSPFQQDSMNLIEQINNLLHYERVSYSARKQSTDIGLLQDEELSEIKKYFNHSPIMPKEEPVPTKDEIYRLIDIELKDVPSSLGLVWSSFNMPNANTSQMSNIHPNNYQQTFECSSSPSSTASVAQSPTTASLPKKISKKRKKSPANNKTTQQPYRVRFGHNLFEEIVFKKSNPNQKFIIFK
ncbi:hypothetical protein NAEGRDRAFT_57441 [Naegleria gruberi]|uniref:Uncharacterized protein n=1 Tax=Naegleria gruberi TaxID=5762 RepID=D2V891_NAEGR|nr:uncharacterized protein NAEGRDRAFT_57441 [Naegleria gruberi]EFC47003.1 hypothetical protein NAEGRDRAFT_57441 [Naegleria gruberi]|eukprot:XP_002679747.1 hypothetical protein NAEGRDRAFT_57441 [Naegleria gruberi strain NEG-M]